jgi:hypothetical protein
VCYGAAEFSRDIDFANVGDLAPVERALLAEEAMARKRDKLYWAPLRRGLESLRPLKRCPSAVQPEACSWKTGTLSS